MRCKSTNTVTASCSFAKTGLPITEYLPEGHEGRDVYGLVIDPTPDKGRALKHKAVPSPTEPDESATTSASLDMTWRDRQLTCWFICLLLICSVHVAPAQAVVSGSSNPTDLQRERALRLQGKRSRKCGRTGVLACILWKSRDSGGGLDLPDSNGFLYSLLVRQTCARELVPIKERSIVPRKSRTSWVACGMPS